MCFFIVHKIRNPQPVERNMENLEFQSIDFHFSQKMMDLSKDHSFEFETSAKLLSYELNQGNVCLNLQDNLHHIKKVKKEFKLHDWISGLKSNAVVGNPGEFKPLILDEENKRLYLQRYWAYESSLSKYITRILGIKNPDLDTVIANACIQKAYKNSKNTIHKAQEQAIKNAITYQFSLISGGPGTGKTYVISKILEVFSDFYKNKHFRIAMATPTGKAANRLKETLTKENLEKGPNAKVSTLHRLLGYIKNSIYFKYNQENLLQLDCLIVDETSMVDLALLSKLIAALPEKCKLILLGDKNQLTSVNAGSVFADLCSTNNASFKLQMTELDQSHRFDKNSGIGRLSQAVKLGDDNACITFLKSKESTQVQWNKLPEPNHFKTVLDIDRYKSLFSKPEISEAFRVLQSFMILCALKNGFYGALKINRMMEELMAQKGWMGKNSTWYRGRPIMILKNDYQLDLFNGDMGIILSDPKNPGKLRAFFPALSGDAKDIYRSYSPSRLPQHETTFATTIHKSQGSEYNEICLILPKENSKALTKELFYTGITRARKKIVLWADEKIILESIKTSILRKSGLKDSLDAGLRFKGK